MHHVTRHIRTRAAACSAVRARCGQSRPRAEQKSWRRGHQLSVLGPNTAGINATAPAGAIRTQLNDHRQPARPTAADAVRTPRVFQGEVASKGHAGWRLAVAQSSDREGRFVERDADPFMDGQVDGELVVAAAQVLHERMPGRDRA